MLRATADVVEVLGATAVIETVWDESEIDVLAIVVTTISFDEKNYEPNSLYHLTR